LEQLRNGVMLQGYRTKPAIANLLDTEPDLAERQPPIRFRASIPTAWLELKLTEGKNRQVRKMTAAVGFPTLRLVRVTIAHLSLADLQVGKWRNLTQAELQELRLKVIPRRLR
jgi:23S rRNA pseudouridine2457 synthase